MIGSSKSQDDGHTGKVFLVLSGRTWQRQCLVCDAVFDCPKAAASHAQSICFPARAHTSN